MFVNSGEAGSFSATLGGDGVVRFSGSESFECVPEGYDDVSMATVSLISGGPTARKGYGYNVHSGSTSVSVDGFGHNIACMLPGDYIYRASFYGGVRKEDSHTHEMECLMEGTGDLTASVYLPRGREITIMSNDRVKGLETIGINYNFPYSSALEDGSRSVTVSIGNDVVYSENDLPESGSIPITYDFSGRKGFIVIRASAGCMGHNRNTESLVYAEPEDSCSLGVGKPVNVASGNVYLNETDFNLKGIMPVIFTRYYDSSETIARNFSAGWGHTYSTIVTAVPGSAGNTYKVINPDGKTVYYIDNDGDRVYDPEFPKGERSRLIKPSYNTYVREFFDGNKEEFNGSGRLTAIVDRNGNRIVLTRGANNSLTSITDPSGRVITVTNDVSNSMITSMTLPDGKVISYTYSAGLLRSVTYPDESRRNYEYIYINAPEGGYRLSGIRDENGHYTEKHTYHTSGSNTGKAITSSADGTNEKLTITYDGDARSTVTDSFGRATAYTIEKSLGQSHATNISGPGCTSCGQSDVAKTYDDNLNVTATTDAKGNVTTMTYDGIGNMLTRTEAYGTAYERTTTYTYNEFGQVLTVTDDDGNTTTYSYDTNGNLTSETDADGNTTTHTYGPRGEKLSTTDPHGHRTSFTYDPYGNPATFINALDQTVTYTYDVMGNRVSMTDVNGNTTAYKYDLRDRLIRETKPDGGVTVYEYDPAGNRTAVIDANGNRTTYVYDSINRVIEIRTDEWPLAPSGFGFTTYTYDAESNMTSMTIRDSEGKMITYESYTYDDHNRLAKTTRADGSYTGQTYDALGNILTKRDENGNVTEFSYDDLNRLAEIRRGAWPFAPEDSQLTTYTYDSRDNLTSITDANGNVTTYTYDRLNRLVSITSPDTGVTVYTYDASGNIISKTDANNVTTAYVYDALSRLTETRFPDPAQNINYFYDDPLDENGKGRLAAITDQSGVTWYDYDKMGRVVRESRLINGLTYTTEYAYDLNGNVLTITYPSGRMITYSYNRLNKIESIADNYLNEVRTLADSIVYQPDGDIEQMAYGNGMSADRRYDGNGRLTGLSTLNSPMANGGQFPLSLSYSRDDAGNITAIADNRDPSKNKSYVYDGLHRLRFAAGPWGAITYAYDAAGNRTYETTDTGNTAYSYIANKLTSSSGDKTISFNYDNNGNIVSESRTGGVTPPLPRTYIFNQNERLTQVYDTGTIWGEYVYNANGQRTKKCTHNGTRCTVFHYDLQGLLISESTDTGDMIAEYIYLNGQPLSRTGSGVISDTDNDGVVDASDNCRSVTNPDQRDTNADDDDDSSLTGIQHYGNICDPDVDNNGHVGLEDYNVWRRYFRQTVPPAPEDVDFNGNGLIGLDDYNIWRKYYGKAPGPGRDSSIEGNKIYYYLNDHLGAPMFMTDESGNTVWQGEFKPFGEPVSVTGSVVNNLRFPGQYYDAETGLHQNWHRDYMPEAGRYMEADPILQPMVDYSLTVSGCSKSRLKQLWRVPGLLPDPQGLYPYVYTKANPVNLMDFNGLVCGSGWTDKIVPDVYYAFDFTNACQNHDDCYGKCGSNFFVCNSLFLKDMLNQCSRLRWRPIDQLSCATTASIYYTAVTTAGWTAYRKAQNNSCCE